MNTNLQWVEDGEEIVEDDSGAVDGHHAQYPREPQQDGHTYRAAQLLCNREGVGLVQFAARQTQDLPQHQGEGQEVDEQDEAHRTHEGRVEGDALQPASVVLDTASELPCRLSLPFVK